MEGATISVKIVLAHIPANIIPNIGGETRREGLIKLHRLIGGNVAYVLLNLGGGRHGNLTLAVASNEYAAQTGFVFVPPHNPGGYSQTKRNAQEQALGNEKF